MLMWLADQTVLFTLLGPCDCALFSGNTLSVICMSPTWCAFVYWVVREEEKMATLGWPFAAAANGYDGDRHQLMVVIIMLITEASTCFWESKSMHKLINPKSAVQLYCSVTLFSSIWHCLLGPFLGTLLCKLNKMCQLLFKQSSKMVPSCCVNECLLCLCVVCLYWSLHCLLPNNTLAFYTFPLTDLPSQSVQGVTH